MDRYTNRLPEFTSDVKRGHESGRRQIFFAATKGGHEKVERLLKEFDVPFVASSDELQAEMRALRSDNAALNRRLERLELERGALSAKPGPAPAASTTQADRPTLTVVKLKPRREPAPPLSTKVEVSEPDSETLEALNETPKDGAGTRRADSQDGRARVVLHPAEHSELVLLQVPQGRFRTPDYRIEVTAR